MSKQPVVPTQTVQTLQNFSLRQTIDSVCNQWKQWKQSIYSSQAYKTVDEQSQKIGKQVCVPLNQAWTQTYNQLPIQTTKLKFNYLQDYSFKERLVFLNLLAIGGALLTLRGMNMYNAWGNSFKAIKNASIVYVFGGLFVAPEIYNPLMKQ